VRGRDGLIFLASGPLLISPLFLSYQLGFGFRVFLA
jgi:hypothetical protein